MKVSKKTEYGLTFLLFLALKEGEDVVGISQIAEETQLPKKFLESIAVALKNSGIINVKRGAQGGYSLSRPAVSIHLLEVFNCLETDSDDKTDSDKVDAKQKTVVAGLEELKSFWEKELSLRTLQWLVDKYREENFNLMYFI